MRRLKGKIIKLGFDSILAMASVAAAVAIYNRGDLGSLDALVRQALVFAIFYVFSSAVFGTHRNVWRYTSMRDLLDIGRAVLATLFAFGLFQHFLWPAFLFAPSFIVVQGLVLSAMVVGQRLLHRLVYEGMPTRHPEASGVARPRVVLVGAGPLAERYIRVSRLNPYFGYNIAGVVDESRTLFGEMLHGVPILGKPKHLETILRDLTDNGRPVQRLVFTENAPGGGADLMDVPPAILEAPEKYGLRLSRLGDMTAFHEGIESVDEAPPINPIAIEDLLGRPQANLDLNSMRELIAGRRVAITGAGGTIGGELSRQIARLGPAAMALLDFSEYNLYALELDMKDLRLDFPWRCLLCNVRVAEQVRKVFAEFQPDIVFHAAALKHVPLVEANPSEG
ncbi:MAG: polysaccharide biosynthesis protein, partial [Alphaproteobacteria bacterium]|nr:polysaccharide biosynthesis protein [Alphaproteobacteria bacterium]